MLCIRIRFAALLAVFFAVGTSVGSLVVMRTDDHSDPEPKGTISGATFTLNFADTADGIPFTAVLTATGSAALDYSTSGLGVSNTVLNDGESLTFSVGSISATGGTVVFTGFTELDFSSFNGTVDQAQLSHDNSIPTLDPQPISGSPMMFTLTGLPGIGGSTSFSVDDVTGNFSGTAVPEPSALAYCVIAALVIRMRSVAASRLRHGCGT